MVCDPGCWQTCMWAVVGSNGVAEPVGRAGRGSEPQEARGLQFIENVSQQDCNLPRGAGLGGCIRFLGKRFSAEGAASPRNGVSVSELRERSLVPARAPSCSVCAPVALRHLSFWRPAFLVLLVCRHEYRSPATLQTSWPSLFLLLISLLHVGPRGQLSRGPSGEAQGSPEVRPCGEEGPG